MIFEKFKLEQTDISDKLDYCNFLINKVQNNASKRGECYLSCAPLAKNIRFISSYFYQNIVSQSIPFISNSCRIGEDIDWERENKDSWYPWIWSRYRGNFSNSDAWNYLFQPITDIVNCDTDIKKVDVDKFSLYLACLNHTFRLNPEFYNYLTEKYKLTDDTPFKNKNVCALQIRRGDMVPPNGDISNGWHCRPLFEISEYMNGVSKVCDLLQTFDVMVSTDSSETIDILKENYPEYNFIYNKFDRSQFKRHNGKDISFETIVRDNIQLAQYYVETCIIDLLRLSQCNGYVGGMKHSEYGICGWFLQMCNNKKITPYYNVEGEFDTDNKSVGMLLL